MRRLATERVRLPSQVLARPLLALRRRLRATVHYNLSPKHVPKNTLGTRTVEEQKLHLPAFADDDPKTAGVMAKVLLLARDHEIKDPTILEQIRS
jgi:hypothetical protein